MEKAAGQGHAYAMIQLGGIHRVRKEYEQTVKWFTMGAMAGLPMAKFSLACYLEEGEGVVVPDCPAAADWYKYGLADIARHVIKCTSIPHQVGDMAPHYVASETLATSSCTLIPHRELHVTL